MPNNDRGVMSAELYEKLDEAELESQSEVTKIPHDSLIKQMKAKLNE